MSARQAFATAPPDITMLREAKVPMPKGETWVSPWRTETCAGSTPSSSQAIYASVVSMPWPCETMPTISMSEPSVIMRAVADS